MKRKISTKLLLLILFIFTSNTFLAQTDPIDSLKREIKLAKHDSTKLSLLLSICGLCNEEDLKQYSLEAIKFAKRKITEEKRNTLLSKFYKKKLGQAFSSMTDACYAYDDYELALKYADSAILIQTEIADEMGKANSINSKGMIYLNTGKNTQAQECFFSSLKIQEKINDLEGQLYSYNNLSTSYLNQGDIKSAFKLQLKSYKIAVDLKDDKMQSNSLNNLGVMSMRQKDFDKAKEYFLRSIKISEKHNDTRNIATCYNNIGIIYSDLDSADLSIQFHRKALKIREELNLNGGIASSLYNIGFQYKQKNEFDTALSYFNKALIIKKKIDDKSGIANTNNFIGEIYFLQNKYKLAEQYSLESLVLSKTLGDPERIETAAEVLSKIYTKTNKPAKALEMYQLFIQMRDSTNNLETRKESLKNQFEIEFDKKERDVKLKSEIDKKAIEIKAYEEKKRQNLIIYSVLIGLIIVVVFSIFIFRSLQRNKKANKIITQQKKEVEKQKEIVEEHQKEILDSINYAKRIQYTLLAHADFLKANLPEHFVFFNPKDIVSGDFYWATKKDDKFYIAACDSTGHGVPGAFMSLLNIGFLSEAINEKGIVATNEVFNYVRQRLTDTISKEGQQDGFDGILVCFDKTNNTISYSAANNAPILVSNGTLIDLPADKMPVGIGERKQDFTLHTLDYKKGDTLYLYTDGYADQFGGPKGKKFKYKPLNEMLIANSSKSLQEQSKELQQTFSSWKGNLEQVDDVLIIGIKL